MQNFDYVTPTRLIFGKGVVEQLPEVMRQYGKRILLTYGGGQILICVGGRGWYQEWGKEPVAMKPGDCVNIPVGVKHWHGAAEDSWFSHLAIEVPGEETSTEWLEASK